MVFFYIDMEKTNFFIYNNNMKEYKETRHTLLYNSTSDLALYAAGYEECKPNWAYGPICRSYQLIHFVLQGKGELLIDEHTFELSEGDIFIIPAGKVAYYKASNDNPWVYSWVSFLGANSNIYVEQLLSSQEEKYIIHNINCQKYKKLIFEIINIQGNTTSQYLKSNSLFLYIISLLFEDTKFNEENWGKTSIADEIKFYIDMNYPKKIKIQDIARNFGIHPFYLTRVFKEKFNMSPKHYLLDLKLKKASRLLVTTDHPIYLIANSLGFEDQLAFSRLFKKKYSISPTEYRKTYKNIENLS